MSSTRYIEIDSTYRDRTKWPNPAEFEVVVAQSGRKDKMIADDPVSDSAPINNFYWNSNLFAVVAGLVGTRHTIVTTVQLVSTPQFGAAGDNKTIIEIISIANDFQTLENYYAGAVAYNSNPAKLQSSRIISYVYMGNNRAQITVEGFTTTQPSDPIQIIDSSDISDLTNPFIFVPNGRIGNNAYPGFILYNSFNNTYANILGYNAVTRLLKLDNITGKGWNLTTAIFSIHKKRPLNGLLNNFTADNMYLSLPPTFTNELDAYKNSYIAVSHNPLFLTPRRIIRYETFTGKSLGTTNINTTINFPNTASKINGYYNNTWIQIMSGTCINNVRKIINYTVTGVEPNLTRVATVDSPFTTGGSGGGGVNSTIQDGDDFTFRSVFLESPLDVAKGQTTAFQIFQFSHDNHNPFVYTGSMQQEVVCYQIELLNIIIPNKILNCGVGSRIAYYPYIYVELSNISGSSSGMKNSIYSNNPNSTSMVFRVPIYDVQNPTNSSFVKLDGDGMTQTLKFKPNDSIFFSVHLSNGELFKTLESETYAPLAPNPEIQISAAFSFKRA
jgi:hypothetical protein